MDRPDAIELLDIGTQFAAAALILGALLLFVSGASGPLGTSFRSVLEPALRFLRERTSLSRSELADASILLAVALAAGAAVTGPNVLAAIVAIGLWLARPSLRRVTREENRMLAIGSYFSIDVLIGLYTPVMLAQFLLVNLLLGSSLLALMIGLSWPAGGGGSSIPGRRWQLAPVRPN